MKGTYIYGNTTYFYCWNQSASHLGGVAPLERANCDPPIDVRLIHTPGTVDEMNRLKRYCAGANFLNPINTSPGTPSDVRRDVDVILNNSE